MATIPWTKDTFKAWAEEHFDGKIYHIPLAFGLGVASLDSNGGVLDALFPAPCFQGSYGMAAVISKVIGFTGDYSGAEDVSQDQVRQMLGLLSPFMFDPIKQHPNIRLLSSFLGPDLPQDRKLVAVVLGCDDEGPETVEDVFLRLHLISHRLVKPHGIRLKHRETGTGIFDILRNVAWTNEGPVSLEDLPQRALDARLNGSHLRVFAVDKLPHMTDYVAPGGVRVADSARVRLGAHLGEGTTVMQEGFVNFNAGTLGSAMIEGRISAGVVIGVGSDLGGGFSTMGTLSGGGQEILSVGDGVLGGAEGGAGISLGDFSVVQAGFYALPQIRYRIVRGEHFDEVVALWEKEKGVAIKEGELVKGVNLSGIPKTTFWQNCETGQVEAVVGRANTVKLNKMLHTND